MSDMCYPDSAIYPPNSALEDADFDQVDMALSLAWSTINALSAYRIAVCPVTVRPCPRNWWDNLGSYIAAPVDGPGGAWVWPMMTGAGNDIVNVLLCGCEWGACHCVPSHLVILPGVVGGIDSITIDGEVLDPAAYRVDGGNQLVRQDGLNWPTQNLDLAAGGDGTWTVSYWKGVAPNGQINWAAGVLAQEWLLSISGDKKCRLPSGTTQIVRAGTSYTVELDWFESGLCGIREVDAVIGFYNPFRRKAPALVLSPDAPPARMTTFGG